MDESLIDRPVGMLPEIKSVLLQTLSGARYPKLRNRLFTTEQPGYDMIVPAKQKLALHCKSRPLTARCVRMTKADVIEEDC